MFFGCDVFAECSVDAVVVAEAFDNSDEFGRLQEHETAGHKVVREGAEWFGPQTNLRVQPVRLARIELLSVRQRKWADLVNAAHAIDRDLLDEKLLFDGVGSFGSCGCSCGLSGLGRHVRTPSSLPEAATFAPVPSNSIAIDASVRSHDAGRTLLGGSPLRLFRLTGAGAAIVETIRSTGDTPSGSAATALLRRLFGAGMAHPLPSPVDPALANVCVVTPVLDDADGLAALLASLDPGLQVVVVDDGSAEPLAAAKDDRDITVLRNDQPTGPGAARNRGWRSVDAELIAFVDADARPTADWLANLLGHFDDTDIAAVAPRVMAEPGTTTLARYELTQSPLDLGPELGRVQQRTRISYVPTAALVVRRSALEALDGFDESMRVGEDVDFIWRLNDAGLGVRYEPRSTVTHRPRSSWPDLFRQRRAYGSAAGPLDAKHPGDVAPAEVNAYSLGAWLLPVVFGRKGLVLGAGVAVASVAALRPKLHGRVDDATTEAIHLGGHGHLFAGRLLAQATTRAWAPLAVVVSLFSRRARIATTAAAIVPAALRWKSSSTELDPARFIAAHIADDLAYCAGVWKGVVTSGRWQALLPRLSGIPGVTTGGEPASNRSHSAMPPAPTDQSRSR